MSSNGKVRFHDSATAGNATLISHGGTATGIRGGRAIFYGHSSAGTATLENHSTISQSGLVDLRGQSTGGNATFYNTARWPSAADSESRQRNIPGWHRRGSRGKLRNHARLLILLEQQPPLRW